MKPFRYPTLVAIALLTVVMTSGCIEMTSQRAYRSWPKPSAARSVNQFDGVYRNLSLNNLTGQPAKTGTELSEMLTGRKQTHGTKVVIRSSRDGNVLEVRLLDDAGRQTDSADLQRGVNYTLSGGAMTLRHSALGWQAKSTRSGPAITHSSFQLHRSATGGLLGHHTDNLTGLMMGSPLFPVFFSSNDWLYWPKLAP